MDGSIRTSCSTSPTIPRIQEELPLEPENHEHHVHVHARSASVALPGPVSPAALVDLLESPPQGAYRMKGRVGVRTRGGMRGYLVNLVGPLVHIARLPRPPEPSGELVAIGMDLDPDAARAALAGVAGSPDDPVDAAGLARLERYRRLSG
ncbi:MAG: GTP-binding protein [Acidipropionibacterium sp.]|jgi:G3E family GTPase|nr:GTP-binding protein [Acidipropionibacterium sp.]